MLRDAVRLALRRLLEISRPRAPTEREVRRAKPTLVDVPILFTPQAPEHVAPVEPAGGDADAPTWETHDVAPPIPPMRPGKEPVPFRRSPRHWPNAIAVTRRERRRRWQSQRMPS